MGGRDPVVTHGKTTTGSGLPDAPAPRAGRPAGRGAKRVEPRGTGPSDAGSIPAASMHTRGYGIMAKSIREKVEEIKKKGKLNYEPPTMKKYEDRAGLTAIS